MKLGLNYILLIIGICLIIGCRSNRVSDKEKLNQIRIENCRSKWKFADLRDTTELTVLLFDKKGRYDLIRWPNFFIGLTLEGDTIGIVDNYSNEKFKKRTRLTFVPYDYGDNIEKTLTLHPGFIVHKKDDDNALYCSVKTVYYGRLMKR